MEQHGYIPKKKDGQSVIEMGDDWKPMAPLQHLRKPRQSGVTQKQSYLDRPEKGVFALSEEDGKCYYFIIETIAG